MGFDIRIGTIIPALLAPVLIPQLNPLGFETYELDFNGTEPSAIDFPKLADEVASVLDGRSISAFGKYANPLADENEPRNLSILMENAPLFSVTNVNSFAGGLPGESVPDCLPRFAQVWEPLADEAGEKGIILGFEGCSMGGTWDHVSCNIAWCPDAWDMMFTAVDSPALMLEWEPTHALETLADPVEQLRDWAERVVHVHGKDATVAWDVIRRYGTNAGRPFVWNRTPGFGDTNWSDLFTILLQSGFEGSCDIEGYHDPVHFDDMEWTAQKTALDYLKRCRGGMEFFYGPAECRGYQGRRK